MFNSAALHFGEITSRFFWIPSNKILIPVCEILHCLTWADISVVGNLRLCQKLPGNDVCLLTTATAFVFFLLDDIFTACILPFRCVYDCTHASMRSFCRHVWLHNYISYVTLLVQYHIYKHHALGLGAYKCDIALVARHNTYISNKRSKYYKCENKSCVKNTHTKIINFILYQLHKEIPLITHVFMIFSYY